MPSLAELTSNHAHVTVTYNGVDTDVEYAPALVTERTLADMMGLARRGEEVANLPAAASGGKRGKSGSAATLDTKGAAGFAQLLDFTSSLNNLIALLVCGWDLTENDGATMFPLVPDRLAELPLAFRQRVVEAVFGDLRMDPQSGMR